MENNILSNLH